VSKATESAPGLEAASWSDHEVGVMASGNPGAYVPKCSNYVATSDHDLLLLPCPDTQLSRVGIHGREGWLNITAELDTRTIMIVALNQVSTMEPCSTLHQQGRDKRGLSQL
jgi:hypothetical protein